MKRRVISGLVLVALMISVWVIYPNFSKRLEKIPPRTKATTYEKRHNKQLALKIATGFGYDKRERTCLLKLWTSESRFDTYAKPKDIHGKQTSTAFGIAQLLGERSSDPTIQIVRGLLYIDRRPQYRGSACRAWQFHLRHHWY